MSIRVGCVGLSIGQQHLRYYSQIDGVEIAAVCDLDPSVANKVAQTYGAKAYTSYEEMIEKENLDAVSICTPPGSHRHITEVAAKNGVHVLCEKPMAPSIEDCQHMIEVCEQANVVLMIGLKKRFSPYYRFIKEMSATHGTPMWASVRYALGHVDKDWFWDDRSGGGPLLENTVHMFDVMRQIMGDVKRVTAKGGNYFMPHRGNVIDAAAVILEFESGGVASMGVGYGSEWPVTREEVAMASPKMTFELSGSFDHADQFRYTFRDKPHEIFTARLHQGAYDGGFKDEIVHFVDCVRHGNRPIANGEAGLESVRICLAVKQSVISGEAVDPSQLV